MDHLVHLDLLVQQETEVHPGRLDSRGLLEIKELGANQVYRVTKDSPDHKGLLASRVSREILAKRGRSGRPVVLVPQGLRVPPDFLAQQD